MKNYVIAMLVMGLFFWPVQAQNYSVSFRGTGAVETVDSVTVLNITQGVSATFAGTDIVQLHTDFLKKFSSQNDVSGNIQIYPNPSYYSASLEFTPACTGEGVILVSDISGKLLLKESFYLNESIEKFSISGTRTGIYFIKVIGRTYQYSAKIVSLNPYAGNIRIERESSEVVPVKNVSEKTSMKGAHTDIPYNEGDWLQFTGYSGIYATIVLGDPVSDTTICFEFVPCTDGDNNNYKVIKIGNQTWMAENLRTTKFNDGALINYMIADQSFWSDASISSYNYITRFPYYKTTGIKYPRAVVSSEKICPLGWHVIDSCEISCVSQLPLFAPYPDNNKHKGSSLYQLGDLWLADGKDMLTTFHLTNGHPLSGENFYVIDKEDEHYIKCIKDPEIPDKTKWRSYWKKQFKVSDPTFSEEFDSITGWVNVSGALDLNTNQVKSGLASIKVKSNIGGNCTMDKNINIKSLKEGRDIKLWIYPHSEPLTSFTGITIFLSTDNEFSNYYYKTISPSWLSQNSWNLAQNLTWSVHGMPDWLSITKMRITVFTITGQTSECSFDLMTCGEIRQPGVMIMFDDNDVSVFKKAFPILKAKKMVATHYTISHSVGNQQRITSSNLLELQENGWSIANHTQNHPDLTKLTESEIIKELSNCKNYLDSIGIKDSNHVAYPYGYSNSTVLSALTIFGAKTGRKVGTYDTYYDSDYPYSINCREIIPMESLFKAKEHIDLAKSNQTVVVLLFHRLVDSNPCSTQEYLVSNFNELINYIESEGLRTLNIDEYYKIYSADLVTNHR